MKVEMDIDTIFYYPPGKLTFYKEVESFDELKTSFLKRFGNVDGASNRTMGQKPLVKQLTYSADSIEEWVANVNRQTDWKLAVRFV